MKGWDKPNLADGSDWQKDQGTKEDTTADQAGERENLEEENVGNVDFNPLSPTSESDVAPNQNSPNVTSDQQNE